MKIIKKKIGLFIAIAVIVILAAYLVWYAFIFFPDDYEITRKEALRTDSNADTWTSTLAVSLIDLLDSAEITGYDNRKMLKLLNDLKKQNFLIKDDPFIKGSRRYLCFRAGTGYPGIWVDERSSIIIPNKATISFELNLTDSSFLEFSAISMLSDGNIDIQISSANNKIIRETINIKQYKHIYSSKDATLKWNNIGFEKARQDTIWKDKKIDLSQFNGLKIKITFSFNNNDKGKDGVVFIANPNIFKHSVKRRFNVIYLIFDGVSTRHFSFYNNRSGLTPYMKKIAEKEFIVFDNMFTLGNKTRISTAGLFSSVLPYDTRHGINRNVIPETEKENYYRTVREGKLEALPNVYRKSGYITEQFGNSGFTLHLNSTGLDYGFERSYEFSHNPYDSYGISHNLFKFLRKNKDREFFLYLHYNTPHKPFYSPLKYFLKGIFNAPLECLWRPDFMRCISYTDDVFKNIFLALKQNNLLENTILVVATDHGAGYSLNKYDKGFQYNDYTRMAFMMRLPETLKKGLAIKKNRLDTYISSVNTAPTIVDLCGLKKVIPFKGRSFSGLLTDKYKDKFFDDEIWCFDRKAMSLITRDMHKYILTFPDGKRLIEREHLFWGDQKEIPFEEIYDLKSDPEEMHNLTYKNKSMLKKFRSIYLKSDIHHPERTVLSFFPDDKKAHTINIDVISSSKIIDSSLHNEKIEKVNNLKSIRNGDHISFSFILKDQPLYFVFENENDRSPLSISIKSDGMPLRSNQIYATYLNLNRYNNPIILNNKTDFLLLNESKFTSKNDIIHANKGLSVKISRIDLHRWIDIENLEALGVSAGMKETLKSWGYIQ